MALIACSECGHQISSLARSCPKCHHTKSPGSDTAPDPVILPSATQNAPDKAAPADKAVSAGKPVPPDNAPLSRSASCEELLQTAFKPSIDEMIILEGKMFLIRSIVNISDCYAYVTSKRYVVCDASGVNVVFQISNNDFASVTDVRHLISRKIVIRTVSGETYQVKCHPHHTWFSALSDPHSYVAAANIPPIEPPAEDADALDWFYEMNGTRIGPVQEQRIAQFIKSNHTVFRDTPVWNKSLPEWKRAEETILTIYFSGTSTSGTDMPKSGSALSAWSIIQSLGRKYF